MQVVLLKDIPKLGKKNETKNVSDGYAMNFLIPKGLAVSADRGATARAETVKRNEERAKAEVIRREAELAKTVSGKHVTLYVKTRGRKLFGAVHPREITDALCGAGVSGMSEKHIIMDKPIKETGVYEMKARFGSKEIRFQVVVRAEGE